MDLSSVIALTGGADGVACAKAGAPDVAGAGGAEGVGSAAGVDVTSSSDICPYLFVSRVRSA